MNCNRGPAEDRAKRNCEKDKLFAIVVINTPNISSNLKTAVLYYFDCSDKIHDTYLDRYYRGYVENKE